MSWDEKVEMVGLLNNGQYEEAVEYIRDKEIDPQAMDMFVTGFDITEYELLRPIEDIITSYDSNSLDWRSGVRLETMKQFLKKKNDE
ncbi:MAG: hypothetical protein IJ456_06695 [Bacteroides sp.]|nr:hypothetical protein [Bacteroides sp.]